jgi:hypothetical protein
MLVAISFLYSGWMKQGSGLSVFAAGVAQAYRMQ